jgi:hypothetical protein
MRFHHVALVALVAALAGCHRKAITYQRRQLPGLSIELPVHPAITSRGEQLDYRTGAVSLGGDVGGPVVVIVQWMAGAKLGPDELALLLGAAGKALHGSAESVTGLIGPDRQPVDSVLINSDGVAIWVTQLPCEGRNVLVASSAPTDARAFQQRLIASLVCTPDPAAEQRLAVTSVPLALSLPGWYATDRSDNQLQLADGASFLMLVPMPRTTSTKLAEAIAPLLEQAVKGAIKVTAGDGGRVGLAGTIDGQAVVGWARLVACPTAKIIAIELSPDQPRAEAVEQAVAAAPCLGDDQPAPTWPDPPK